MLPISGSDGSPNFVIVGPKKKTTSQYVFHILKLFSTLHGGLRQIAASAKSPQGSFKATYMYYVQVEATLEPKLVSVFVLVYECSESREILA